MIPRKIHTNSRSVMGLEPLGCIVTRLQSENEPTRAHPWPEFTYQLLWCFAVFGTETMVDWWIILRNGSYNNSVLGRARVYPKVRGWFAFESSIYRSLVAGP